MPRRLLFRVAPQRLEFLKLAATSVSNESGDQGLSTHRRKEV
jgi:hypothetical protein